MIQLTKGQLEFRFSFKAIKELMTVLNIELPQVGDVTKDLKNIHVVAYIGHKNAGGKLSQEEIETMLDEGTFEDLKAIGEEFSKQVIEYFGIPNEMSQSPLNA